MSIPTVKALFLHEELYTNSYPMLVACDNGKNYFVKQPRMGAGDIELVFEVVAHQLARHFNISTPEIAYVVIPEGAIDNNFVAFNIGVEKDTRLFGSQEIPGALDLRGEVSRVTTKHDFNRIENALDLVTIALFDVHIGNRDRSYYNFNLLYDQSGGKQKIVAFDHVAIFEKAFTGEINPNAELNFAGCILDNAYGQKIRQYLELDDVQQRIDEYFENITGLEAVVNTTFETFPPSWRYNDDLKERIIRFLTDPERIVSLRSQIKLFLQLS